MHLKTNRGWGKGYQCFKYSHADMIINVRYHFATFSPTRFNSLKALQNFKKSKSTQSKTYLS